MDKLHFVSVAAFFRDLCQPKLTDTGAHFLYLDGNLQSRL